MKNFILTACAVWFLLGNHAYASGLQVSPVSITTDAAKISSVIHVSNEGESPIQAQIRIFSWRQENNKDVLVETNDIVASPPFVKLGPGSKQLVRLVRTSLALSTVEANYRLMVDELPMLENQKKGINLNLRYSIPLRIVQKDHAEKKSALSVDWDMQKEEFVLSIKNSGNVRAQIGTVKINNGAEEYNLSSGLVGYVLPDSEMQWKFKIKDTYAMPKDISISIDGVTKQYKK